MITALLQKSNEYLDQFSPSTISASPEKFKRATMELFDAYVDKEREFYEKKLDNLGEIQTAQDIKYDTVTRIMMLAREIDFASNFDEKFKTACLKIKENIDEFKEGVKEFSVKSTVSVFEKILNNMISIDRIVSDFKRDCSGVRLKYSSLKAIDRLSVFNDACKKLKMLPVLTDTNSKNAKPRCCCDIVGVVRIYRSLAEFLDDTFEHLDKEDGLEVIRRELQNAEVRYDVCKNSRSNVNRKCNVIDTRFNAIPSEQSLNI